MKCPVCGAAIEWANPTATCSHCGCSRGAAETMAVDEIDFLLAEIGTWSDLLPEGLSRQLRHRYHERRDRLVARIIANTGKAGNTGAAPG